MYTSYSMGNKRRHRVGQRLGRSDARVSVEEARAYIEHNSGVEHTRAPLSEIRRVLGRIKVAEEVIKNARPHLLK